MSWQLVFDLASYFIITYVSYLVGYRSGQSDAVQKLRDLNDWLRVSPSFKKDVGETDAQ